MSKYGEPWSIKIYEQDSDEMPLIIVSDAEDMQVLPELRIGSLHDAELEVCERIVTCGNACAGMDDPEAEIARLREIAKKHGETP